MRALIESTPLHGLVFTLSEVLAKRKSLFRMTGVLRSIKASTLVLRGEQDNVCRSATKLLSQTIPGPRAAGAAYEEREGTPSFLIWPEFRIR